MNIKQLKSVVDNTTASSITFAGIVQETVPEMNKGGRGNMPVNPFYDRVKKVTHASIMLGNEYEKAVRNRIVKITGEEAEFNSQPPKGKHWKTGYEKLILVKDTDESVEYLRTYHLSKNIPNSTYYIDGVKAEGEQLEELKKWIKKPSESKKQAEAGLEEENQVVVRDVTLTNVKELKIGDYHFSA